MVEIAAKAVFRVPEPPIVADPLPEIRDHGGQKKRAELMKKRAELRIGMPRALNMYSHGAVLHRLLRSRSGVKAENIVWSDYTSEQLYKEGAKRGAIDPCFPSKVGIPHVHNLLYQVHPKKPLDIIFFPMIDCATGDLKDVHRSRACPTVTATPEAVKAAFTKEGDLFTEKGVVYMDTLRQSRRPEDVRAADVRGVRGHPRPLARRRTSARSERATRRCDEFDNVNMRGGRAKCSNSWSARTGSASCCSAVRTTTIPASTTRSWTSSRSSAIRCSRRTRCRSTRTSSGRLFGDEVRAGRHRAPDGRSPTCGRTPTARTPSARCGRPSTSPATRTWWPWSCRASSAATTRPIYTVIEEIVEHSGTPYFCFKDIDENKPAGSIKIRVETIGYFLKRYREDLADRRTKNGRYRTAARGVRVQAAHAGSKRAAGRAGRR